MSSAHETAKSKFLASNGFNQDILSLNGQEKSDRKENRDSNISTVNVLGQTQIVSNIQLVALDVPPPREVPDDERILRDRKDRQIKLKEAELKEQQEKEEREKQRLKYKMDAFAEIEKSQYTYDHNGNIIMVKKPNLNIGGGAV